MNHLITDPQPTGPYLSWSPYKRRPASADFSSREKDILTHMASGKTAQEIADDLFLSPHTIKTHQKNMLKRTGSKNSIQLIANCLRLGIII